MYGQEAEGLSKNLNVSHSTAKFVSHSSTATLRFTGVHQQAGSCEASPVAFMETLGGWRLDTSHQQLGDGSQYGALHQGAAVVSLVMKREDARSRPMALEIGLAHRRGTAPRRTQPGPISGDGLRTYSLQALDAYSSSLISQPLRSKIAWHRSQNGVSGILPISSPLYLLVLTARRLKGRFCITPYNPFSLVFLFIYVDGLARQRGQRGHVSVFPWPLKI